VAIWNFLKPALSFKPFLARDKIYGKKSQEKFLRPIHDGVTCSPDVALVGLDEMLVISAQLLVIAGLSAQFCRQSLSSLTQ
jgi:hypothetical protein